MFDQLKQLLDKSEMLLAVSRSLGKTEEQGRVRWEYGLTYILALYTQQSLAGGYLALSTKEHQDIAFG